MPKPYIFKSESELIDLLGNNDTLTFVQNFYSANCPTIFDVVISGVTGNTFRAFRNLPIPPSDVFRVWAIEYIEESLIELSQIDDESKYAIYVHLATLSLCECWTSLTKSEMGYGRGAKLFNLVLKKFACLTSLTKKQKQTLINLQHVPLDSYTIVGLRDIAPNLSISSNSTMNFVKTPDQYKEFQTIISNIANKAGVPAIYYDILAWDMGHR